MCMGLALGYCKSYVVCIVLYVCYPNYVLSEVTFMLATQTHMPMSMVMVMLMVMVYVMVSMNMLMVMLGMVMDMMAVCT